MSISGLLNVSWNALTSNQIAMNVTGSNISNVNTAGYTRQRAETQSVGRVDVGAGQADYGVEVSSIRRFYDRYLETQLADQTQKTGFDETRQQILGQVEGIFSESGDSGLNELMNQFWNAWESLSSSPSNQVARDQVVTAAGNLASLLRENSVTLTSLQQDIQTDLAYSVEEVNGLTQEIADLNQQILASDQQAGNTNALQDRRQELLKELGSNINANYYENSDGTVTAFLSGGLLLVGGNQAATLVADSGQVTLKDKPTDVLNDRITGGKIGAMIEMGERTLQGYLDDLDALAVGIATAVNTQHQAGLDANGDPGGLFFAATTGARNIQVSAAVQQDPLKVAAADLAGGNGENARQIGAIKESLSMNGGTATFDDFYAVLVGRVGYDARSIESSIERNTAVTNHLTEQRESVSGVSMDEEIMNLMKYQFGYNAAGRLVKVADELVDVLMSLGK